MRYMMGSTRYRMLLILILLHHSKSDNLQIKETPNISISGNQSEFQIRINQERTSKISPISEQKLLSAGISPLLQYHENFQTKNVNQNIHSLTGTVGNTNFKTDSSGKLIQIPDNLYASLSSSDALKVKKLSNKPFDSQVLPSYAAQLITNSTTENYSYIQQQFAYKPSNTSSYSQIPTLEQNIAYKDYLNQLSLYHVLNNLQQTKQTNTPIPAPTTPTIQTESKPSPPPVDEHHYSNIAYIPAVHGTQLQELLSISPPAPPPQLIPITGSPNVLPPGIPDTDTLIENSVQNTPGITSTSIANCLKGRLCSFILASLIAAGTTGALALPVAWPYLGAFFGRKKRDTALDNPILNELNEISEKFIHNENNIPTWIIDWYNFIIHSDIIDKENLTTFLGLSVVNNTELQILENLHFDDVINSSKNIFKHLDTIKENNENGINKKPFTSINPINDYSDIGSINVPRTSLMPPNTIYQDRLQDTLHAIENMKIDHAYSDDYTQNNPPFNTIDFFSKTCNVIDNNEIPKNIITNYISLQCNIMV